MLPLTRSTAATAVLVLAATAVAGPTVVTLEPVADTSIFDGVASGNSNGAGPDLYAGRVGPPGENVRQRSLFRFDLSSIPADASIVDAELTLNLIQPGPFTVPDIYAILRVTSPWGEGGAVAGGGQGAPATPGDATWDLAEVPGTPWNTPGGDFDPVSSASLEIGTVGNVDYTFVDAGLAADVADWVAGVEPNHGWILIGNEVDVWTARKWGSRENDPTRRPRLQITFEVGPPPCIGDLDGSGSVDFPDLLTVLANFGPCADCPADFDGSGDVGFSDLLSLLANFGGCIGD